MHPTTLRDPASRRLIAALAILTSLAPVAACNKDQSATGDAARSAMGLYAKGFNLLLRDPHQMIDEYFHTIPDSGPVLENPPHLFPSQSSVVRAIKDAREAFSAAKESAPTALADLGTASDHVLVTIEKVTAVYTEAEKYYEAENYKDDRLAKGKQLHVAMVAAVKDFDVAMGTLGDGLSAIEDAQATAEIKDRETDKSYGYWFRWFDFEAKKFLHAAREAKQIDAAYPAITAAHDALTAFAKANGRQLATGFQPYLESADSFYAACTKLGRAAAGTPSEIRDGQQALTSAYNALISSGNFLYELESTDSLK